MTSEPDDRPVTRGVEGWWLPLALRGVVLTQAAVLAWADAGVEGVVALVPLAIIASAVSLVEATARSRRWLPPLEAALAGAAIGLAGSQGYVALPYLVVPAFAAGLQFGALVTLASVASAGVTLLIGGIVVGGPAFAAVSDLPELVQWLSLSLALGFVGWWGRRQRLAMSDAEAAYEAASRLLGDLRDLTPRLTYGLDAPALAVALLDDAATAIPYSRGAVIATYPSEQRVQLLAARNADNDWLAGVEEAAVRGSHPSSSTVWTEVLLGQDATGVLVVDADRAAQSTAVASLDVLARRHRLRLQAATAFNEIREIASREERLRISREIHDGIAQDLAAFGYAFDDALQALPQPAPSSLKSLRRDLSTLLRQLRLSVFELRELAGSDPPLAVAVAEHARRTANVAQLELRLSVRGTENRFGRQVERELTRIAQEAVTNTRKHAHASTLSVTIEQQVDRVSLEIADDGRGISFTPLRSDSSGLVIMRERAAAIGADLSIEDRPGGGTVVRVSYREES